MPPRGMYEALPVRQELGRSGHYLYECALCGCLHPPEGLFWTFWRQPQGWILWPLIRRPHDPCYGYLCKACRNRDRRVDARFVPATPLLNVLNSIDDEIDRHDRHVARYGRQAPTYECFTCQEPDGTWLATMGEDIELRKWSAQGGSGMWLDIIAEKEQHNRGPAEVVLHGYTTCEEAELALMAWKPDCSVR